MAVSYVWPGSLPQSPLTGYSEDSGVNMLRTPTTSGPAKQRKRGNYIPKLGVSFMMTSEQVATLETFTHDTIKGTARFGFPHPRLRTQAEVRIVPQDGGTLYSLSDSKPGNWLVTMTLEVLP